MEEPDGSADCDDDGNESFTMPKEAQPTEGVALISLEPLLVKLLIYYFVIFFIKQFFLKRPKRQNPHIAIVFLNINFHSARQRMERFKALEGASLLSEKNIQVKSSIASKTDQEKGM